jgi:hypothetical protein
MKLTGVPTLVPMLVPRCTFRRLTELHTLELVDDGSIVRSLATLRLAGRRGNGTRCRAATTEGAGHGRPACLEMLDTSFSSLAIPREPMQLRAYWDIRGYPLRTADGSCSTVAQGVRAQVFAVQSHTPSS